ncbi:MAG: Putrescine transport system permease protein PotI, partial [uncultured Nocardioides sp.]
ELDPTQPGADAGARGARLHLRADLHRRADELQRPAQPQRLLLRRLHPRQLAQPLPRPVHVRRGGPQHHDRDGCHAGLHGAGHARGVRARAAPLRRSLVHQPAGLPADGGPRDRAGLLAAGALRLGRVRRTARVPDDPHRPHPVLPVLRHRDRAGAPGRHGRQPRAGGPGPLRDAGPDVLAGDLPAGLPGDPRCRPAELLALVRRLHHHQPQRRHHHDVPDVRLGRGAARRADAGERHRHPHVRRLDRDRARRGAPQPPTATGRADV